MSTHFLLNVQERKHASRYSRELVSTPLPVASEIHIAKAWLSLIWRLNPATPHIITRLDGVAQAKLVPFQNIVSIYLTGSSIAELKQRGGR